jgi:beta-N-acetylhexosaminidase
VPGRGRASVDTHLALPRVDTPLAELEATDFAPFRALAGMPWAMTAHILYGALDDQRAATVSPLVIAEVIRGSIGFDGLLVSDDLSMEALGGTIAARAEAALAAGCDLVLHCNGRLAEMISVGERVGPLSAAASRRVGAAEARRGTPEPFDRAVATARLAALLEGQG